MTDGRYRVAIHESGHAVLAELLCLNPVSVTIEPDKKTLGHLRRRGVYGPVDGWRNLLLLCAGHIAEGLIAEDAEGLIAEDMESDEYLNSYDVLRWPFPDEEITDSAQTWASLQEHSEDEQQRLAWFDLAFAQTKRILSNRAVWRSVESLAGRLMEKRTIDYSEAADVIEAALGRSKWTREQFQMSERYAMPPQTWIDSREEYLAIAMALAARKKRGAAK